MAIVRVKDASGGHQTAVNASQVVTVTKDSSSAPVKIKMVDGTVVTLAATESLDEALDVLNA